MSQDQPPKLLTTGKATDFTPIMDSEIIGHEMNHVHIDPDTFYRPAYIRQVLGTRCVNHLTNAGLQSVGGWYFGGSILAACRRVWHTEPVNPRGPDGKEVRIEPDHAITARMDQAIPQRSVQPVPRKKATESLQCQLEAFKRKVRP